MNELDLTAANAEDAKENEANRLTFTIIGAAIEVALFPIHHAQLLSYLKLGGWQAGLIINFNFTLLNRGIRPRVLNLKERNSASSAVNLFS